MPLYGRARHVTKLVNKKSNTGNGGVRSFAGFMGRGIVLRKQIMKKAVCSKSGDCYTSKQMNPANQ